MSHRISRNGKPTLCNQADAENAGDYVKNEVDQKLDRLNSLWMRLEKKLLTEQPPRRISCQYHTEETGEDGDVTERRFLGIQRHAGKWRICYAITWDCYPQDEWKPIVECDVQTRTDAVNGIEMLRREVKNTRKRFIPELDKAISALEHAIDGDEE